MPTTENIHILQQYQESALLTTKNNKDILQHNVCHVYLNLHKNNNIYHLLPQGLYTPVSPWPLVQYVLKNMSNRKYFMLSGVQYIILKTWLK